VENRRLREQPLSDDDYRALAAFRAGLRRFLHFSEEAARAAGLTPQQHQLLVAVRGHSGPEPPTIGEVADALQIKHHSAVGLIDRMTEAGYVQRAASTVDSRRVHVLITPAGEEVLHSLTAAHRLEYRQLADALRQLIDRFESA
jgi:DNA-binding MarR family transcriptional regulator